MLNARSWSLGGENSGHIVCLDRHTTGDGIVSALQVLHALLTAKTTLAKAVNFKLYPQVLINVRLGSGAARSVVASATVQRAVAAAERALGASGRVLLRPSGTEPVIRVMVEGQAKARVKQLAGRIAKAVAAAN